MNEPIDPRKLPADVPPASPTPSDPSDTPLSEADLRDGTIDFNVAVRPAMGSGPPKLHKMSEPISGGSVISWAELLRQQQRRRDSDDEVILGSLPEIQIDAVSDKDIVKHLERESRAAQNKQPAPPAGSNPPAAPPMASGGTLAAKLFQREPALPPDDWFVEGAKPDSKPLSSSVDLRSAAKASADLEGRGGRSTDESDVLAHALLLDDGNSAVNLGLEPRVSGIISKAAVLQGVSRMDVPAGGQDSSSIFPSAKSPATRQSRRPRALTSWLGATAVGLAAGAGLAVGVWYGKRHAPVVVQQVVKESQPVASAPPAAVPTLDVGRRHLEAGDPESALATFAELPDAPETLLGRGQARWLGYVRQQRLHKVSPREQDPAVAAARRELAASHLAEGFLWMGLINETLGERDTAQKTYQNGLDQFPEKAKLFQAALARLDALAARKPSGVAKAAPELGLALSLILVNEGDAPAADEAGFDYWQAVGLARQHKFGDARDALLRARAAHDERRTTFVRQGLNPGSDPREDIFLYGCDQLLSYWDVQAKLEAEGYKFDAENPAETIGTLLTSHKRMDAALQAVAAKLSTDKPDEVVPALDALIAARQKAEADYQQAQKTLTAVRQQAQADARQAAKDLQAARGGSSKTDEAFAVLQARAAEQAKISQAKLEEATARETAARKAVADLTAARKDADDAVQAVAAKLRAAKLIGAQAQMQDILNAIDTVLNERTALSRGTLSPVPAVEKPDPELAEKALSAGLRFYYERQYAQAEEQLVTALKNSDQDARILYFLGLARLPLGKIDAAQDNFRRAAALEKDGQSDTRAINTMLERVQGPERQFINRFRQ